MRPQKRLPMPSKPSGAPSPASRNPSSAAVTSCAIRLTRADELAQLIVQDLPEYDKASWGN
jgi:hypothetical protein